MLMICALTGLGATTTTTTTTTKILGDEGLSGLAMLMVEHR
jgi:hypothetical protein